jgi:hypothetical protein
MFLALQCDGFGASSQYCIENETVFGLMMRINRQKPFSLE